MGKHTSEDRVFYGNTIETPWTLRPVPASVVVESLHTQPHVTDGAAGRIFHGFGVLDFHSILLLVIVLLRVFGLVVEASMIHCAGGPELSVQLCEKALGVLIQWP